MVDLWVVLTIGSIKGQCTTLLVTTTCRFQMVVDLWVVLTIGSIKGQRTTLLAVLTQPRGND